MSNKIPMVDLYAQYQSIKPEIDRAISSTLEKTAFIGGRPVRQFEEEFADFLGPGEVVSCANGTDSMELTLKALDITKGDEVIVPAHTWISTSEVVVTAGATPVFADVDFDTCCIDVTDVERKIAPKTKAIIAVHLYGHPADIPALAKLAEKHNFQIIEDCAQAHGSKIDGKNVGTMGVAGSFSFYPGKNLGCYGDGGAVYTENKELALTIKQIANHGQLTKHQHTLHGRNSRLDTLQARVLSAKLPHLYGWIERKNEHAALYSEGLKDVGEIHLPKCVGDDVYHSWHLYVIKLKDRDGLKNYLKEQDIHCGVHYPKALPFQPCYADFGHTPNDFPVAAKLQNEVLSLPMYAELKKKQLDRVIECIKTYFAQ